jgi:uncharacterized protein (TIGR03067 family)
MKRVIALGLMTLFGMTVFAAERDTKTAPLRGAYTFVSGQMDGKEVSPEKLRGCKSIFTADGIASTDKHLKHLYSCTYKLDTTAKPWQISMVSKSPSKEKAEGIVELEGDTLKLAYSLPGAERPTSFTTTKKGQHLFILKREKDSKSR